MSEKRRASEDLAQQKDTGLFAATNSGLGFVSFYERVFNGEQIRKRYIIKGGPGTGKSSFLREVASYAEKKGLGVEYYRCSSDPDSLDGIVIDGRIAMLDGTAPHAEDAELPGVRDEMINLGEFWDGERLTQFYNEIVSLSALKGNSYRKAYRYLSAAMDVSKNNDELIRPAVLLDKMRAAVKRMCANIPDGREFSCRPGLIVSIGMKGSVRLSTYERQARKLYVLDDCFHSAHWYLSLLMEQAREKRCAVRVSYQPLDPSELNAVFFVDSGECFVIGGEGETREPNGRINMRRFLSKERLGELREEYRANKRLCEGLMDAAGEALIEAGRYHFDLERIYSSCMDFDSQRKFIRSFCQKIE